MLKLVKPSKKYLPAFMRVYDDYKQDTNQFKNVQVGELIKAIDEKRKVTFKYFRLNIHNKRDYQKKYFFEFIHNSKFTCTLQK